MFKQEFKTYICVCGREFSNSQAFNGHKSHCEQHLLNKGYDKTFLEKRNESSKKGFDKAREVRSSDRILKIQEQLKKWLSEQHTCEKCGKVMTEKFGSGRFCSRSCANSHDMSNVDKTKFISNTKTGKNSYSYKKALKIYNENPSYCKVCGKLLSYKKRNRKCCSNKCVRISKQKAGLRSCQVQSEVRRSKNEIYFYNKCVQVFKNVKHNEPIFNGWDADIIIEDLKIAILWNGIWHYKQVRHKHSVKQVQSRDAIKLSNIKDFGYTPYIIKDLNSCNYAFVNNEFIKFIDWIEVNYGPLAQLVRAVGS